MSKIEKQKQTEKFVGCILSVKTKPGQYGDVQHIIGTVREIDVDSAEQAIVLDQAMSNGAMLPDGFVLLSSQIADLQVMGKANEIQANLQSAYCQSEALKTQKSSSDEINHESETTVVSQRTPSQSSGFGNCFNSGVSNGSDSLRTINGNHAYSPRMNNSSALLVNSIASAMSDMAVKNNLSESDHDSSSHLIAKPKPRKPAGDANSSYTSPPQQKGLTPVTNIAINKGSTNSNRSSIGTNHKSSTNVGLSSSTTPNNGNDILMRTFGNLAANSGISVNGQALFNAVANSSKSSVVPVANLKQNDVQSPSKLSSQKPVIYDHKKLGVLSQFVKPESSTAGQVSCEESRSALTLTPSGKTVNSTFVDPNKTPRNHQGKGVRQRHGETFESMSKDEMSTEFDFEESNAQFEKCFGECYYEIQIIPVTSNKPTRVVKNPHFSTTDTTYNADRVVESVTVRETVKSVKQFVTDTGVVIPSVDLPTRSKILNMAHEYGLTHSRVVEVMGRAVAQAALPLLGDSYRLSPEREEDRPWVLICAGPHWQGAIGIAAARILASLGVHTCIHAPKEELQLCATEEKLYSGCDGILSRQISQFKSLQFDLVIMAADDHLSREVTYAPYSRWLKNCPMIYVDPPLISSYRQHLDAACGSTHKTRKIVIVSPVLPIAYPTDLSVKIFLVNLGIPQDIFQKNGVGYKSPFGDKLIIQIFSSSK